MKNKARIKVRQFSCLDNYDYVICIGRRKLMQNIQSPSVWRTEKAAKRNAKKMAELIGIPFEDGLVKTHGC